MAFAPPKNSDGAKLQTKMSTWTPLNHQLMNDKVFEERGSLLGKWFDKWSDAQRRKVLCDLFERCNVSQLKFCNHHLQARVPRESLDFTAFLPRVLSLYIFSFLDPRSLCRCAQVSWHWKTLAELDQLWMLKCLRFGWYINFTPTPFEQCIWKRQYIEMVKELNVTRPRTPPKDSFVVIDVQPIAKEVLDLKPFSHLTHRPVSSKAQSKGGKDLPPWRSSDKHPTDTFRFNYLDNYDPMEQARQGRQSTLGTSNRSHQDPERKKRPSSASYKLRKAKSLLCKAELGSGASEIQMSLAGGFTNTAAKAPSRPSWAAHQSDYPVTKATAKSLAQSNTWNAGIRPAPIRAAIPAISKRGMKAYTRTSRSSPTAALFESQPWELPASDQGSDEE